MFKCLRVMRPAVAASLALALLVARVSAATAEPGQLVVCLASKGEFDKGQPANKEGLIGLAALAHKYGFPVTYYLKPFVAEAAKDELKSWSGQYGDEVGWFSEGTSFRTAEAELNRLRNIVTWQPIRATGNTKYGPEWVELYQRHKIESVWGRCYEQTFVDGITDRGCPPGFYYARPDCFKVPNTQSGGVISVPWLSNDLNLCFRTAWQPTFTFDPNDTEDIGASTPTDSSFWEAELDEYQKQTKYNRIVPLVVQQETGEFERMNKWKRDGAAILENLFKVLQRRGIKVVTVSQAVELYKKAYPQSTPPTYAIFGNISTIPCIKDSKYFKLSRERFTTGTGPTLNGYYACNRMGNVRNYYHPAGVSMYEQKRNFTYFDANGLLVYEEGNPQPIRITPYFGLPPNAFKEKILPELSYWFDTDRYIPKAAITKQEGTDGLQLKITATYARSPISSGERLPYGVMLWGDYSAYQLPADAPAGTKILAGDGLFIPLVLKVGINHFELDLHALADQRNKSQAH